MNKKIIILISLMILDLFFVLMCTLRYLENKENIVLKNSNESIIKNESKGNTIDEPMQEQKDVNVTRVVLNAVGDCTIGYDDNFGYSNSFNDYLDRYGYSYFFSNVKDIFLEDDITVANLETTFTNSSIKKEKKFNFKAPPEYVNVLTNGNIEAVNIANNHIFDYNEVGYNDTINVLNNGGINYFGFDNYYIYEKDNVKIGFAGIFCIESLCIDQVDKVIEYFKEKDVNSIILSFHWGLEKNYKQSSIQIDLAHYAIDKGVELVLGHHPHVLQGIELYKDKYIVYSLGNFSFGGNKNPVDKDTMIFNIEFNYKNGDVVNTVINIYPASISSLSNINDYKPMLYDGIEKDRVLKKIEANSIGISIS